MFKPLKFYCSNLTKSSSLEGFHLFPRALQEADVILLLGARLNWILHFGAPPRFRPDVKIIQVRRLIDHIYPKYLHYDRAVGLRVLSQSLCGLFRDA